MENNNSWSFKDYFDQWLAGQERDLHELISAANDNQNDSQNDQNDSRRRHGSKLRGLTRRVMGHYEEYYMTKSEWAHRDVLSMLSPPWRSSLEEAFLWIGGWRPSMAFHVIYSKSGLQLESRMSNNPIQYPSPDLADLSCEQFGKMDKLQRRTIGEEKEITEKMAKVQESVADASMVELSHAASEMTMDGRERRVMEDEVERTLSSKERSMEEVLKMADDLRLRTLRAIVDE